MRPRLARTCVASLACSDPSFVRPRRQQGGGTHPVLLAGSLIPSSLFHFLTGPDPHCAAGAPAPFAALPSSASSWSVHLIVLPAPFPRAAPPRLCAVKVGRSDDNGFLGGGNSGVAVRSHFGSRPSSRCGELAWPPRRHPLRALLPGHQPWIEAQTRSKVARLSRGAKPARPSPVNSQTPSSFKFWF